MKRIFCLLLAATAAHAASPEIVRAPAAPQRVGADHALRFVPEACVTLHGRFAAGGGAPYMVSLARRPGCAPRAGFDAAIGAAPPLGEGWILNDVLQVPRADRPDCVARVSVWRHPGVLAPLERDGQRRVRMYLDQSKPPASQRSRFAASVATTPACG